MIPFLSGLLLSHVNMKYYHAHGCPTPRITFFSRIISRDLSTESPTTTSGQPGTVSVHSSDSDSATSPADETWGGGDGPALQLLISGNLSNPALAVLAS